MRHIHLSLTFCFLVTSCATHSPRAFANFQYSAADLQAEAPTSKIKSKSYLSLDVPFKVFDRLRTEVEETYHVKLKHRGEAHITVITPPEIKALKSKVSFEEIQEIASSLEMHKVPYKLVCIGKGTLKGQSSSTFYVVVDSERLFQIRKAVEDVFTKRGGLKKDFNSDLFYPHITLGFTEKDLHFEDGVIKDASTCIHALHPHEAKDN